MEPMVTIAMSSPVMHDLHAPEFETALETGDEGHYRLLPRL